MLFVLFVLRSVIRSLCVASFCRSIVLSLFVSCCRAVVLSCCRAVVLSCCAVRAVLKACSKACSKSSSILRAGECARATTRVACVLM